MTQTRLKEQKNGHAAVLAPAAHAERNPGGPLDLGWIEEIRVNRSAVERRAATLPGRRTVKKEWQAAWLLRAISCIDLTTLSGDDTPGTRAAPVRQGAPAGARRPARRARRAPRITGRRGLRLSRASSPRRSRRCTARASRSPRSRPAFPAGL